MARTVRAPGDFFGLSCRWAGGDTVQVDGKGLLEDFETDRPEPGACIALRSGRGWRGSRAMTQRNTGHMPVIDTTTASAVNTNRVPGTCPNPVAVRVR
jgi:hypothetical protein